MVDKILSSLNRSGSNHLGAGEGGQPWTWEVNNLCQTHTQDCWQSKIKTVKHPLPQQFFLFSSSLYFSPDWSLCPWLVLKSCFADCRSRNRWLNNTRLEWMWVKISLQLLFLVLAGESKEWAQSCLIISKGIFDTFLWRQGRHRCPVGTRCQHLL